MAKNFWQASQDIYDLVDVVKTKYHLPRLENAKVAVCFQDSKTFVKNKLNLGNVSKFSGVQKLWQKQNYDFCITIPFGLWSDVLKNHKEAFLDLCLSRCSVEYIPLFQEENGKKRKIVDEYGRVEYSSEIKTDDVGNPVYKILPLDIEVFTENASRYGIWMECLVDFKKCCDEAKIHSELI